MKKLLILGILCSLSYSVNATVWKCTFNEQARLVPYEGIQVSNNLNFELMFEINDNKVNVIGNNGSEPVRSNWGDNAVTFVEELNTGINQTTTVIFQSGSAVHSRHTLMGGAVFLPSQYYGACVNMSY
jgi:hypothetical protein